MYLSPEQPASTPNPLPSDLATPKPQPYQGVAEQLAEELKECQDKIARCQSLLDTPKAPKEKETLKGLKDAATNQLKQTINNWQKLIYDLLAKDPNPTIALETLGDILKKIGGDCPEVKGLLNEIEALSEKVQKTPRAVWEQQGAYFPPVAPYGEKAAKNRELKLGLINNPDWILNNNISSPLPSYWLTLERIMTQKEVVHIMTSLIKWLEYSTFRIENDYKGSQQKEIEKQKLEHYKACWNEFYALEKRLVASLQTVVSASLNRGFVDMPALTGVQLKVFLDITEKNKTRDSAAISNYNNQSVKKFSEPDSDLKLESLAMPASEIIFRGYSYALNKDLIKVDENTTPTEEDKNKAQLFYEKLSSEIDKYSSLMKSMSIKKAEHSPDLSGLVKVDNKKQSGFVSTDKMVHIVKQWSLLSVECEELIKDLDIKRLLKELGRMFVQENSQANSQYINKLRDYLEYFKVSNL